jgi:hypothetical protein|tara:strand:- start:21209 stop:21388 length:180 start_codon:yes stop_codon:yes gene_type:complete
MSGLDDGAIAGEHAPLLVETGAGNGIRNRATRDGSVMKQGRLAIGAAAVCGVLALTHGT